MAIGYVVQKGVLVYIYDEKGKQTAAFTAPKNGLKGYTSSTVNIQDGAFIIIYDEKGQRKSKISSR